MVTIFLEVLGIKRGTSLWEVKNVILNHFILSKLWYIGQKKLFQNMSKRKLKEDTISYETEKNTTAQAPS